MRIELNHWFIHKNELGISLPRYYVGILICPNNNIELKVMNYDGRVIILNFNCLEDAIYFTENYINKCAVFDKIKDIYDNVYNDNFDMYKPKRSYK